ncbi:hypothetical protein M8J75_011487 [Diaphorina citri]|jgi:hypothetical protein|nr:hypothetical protein M8J75_011487 [Diaphorina citri]KAI5739366.1 hypothetical protein M8J77_018414 [Diaphorina citri]
MKEKECEKEKDEDEARRKIAGWECKKNDGGGEKIVGESEGRGEGEQGGGGLERGQEEGGDKGDACMKLKQMLKRKKRRNWDKCDKQ